MPQPQQEAYTMLLAPTTLTVSPHMQSPQQYDAIKDFAPIARGAVLPMAIVTSPTAPYKTLKELIAYAKANPAKLSYATSGKGSPSHLEMEPAPPCRGDIRAPPAAVGTIDHSSPESRARAAAVMPSSVSFPQVAAADSETWMP
jgi:hypothetical protein